MLLFFAGLVNLVKALAVDKNPEDLLTVNQVLEELQHHITRATVAAWCRSGKLPARRAGQKWLIRRGDLEAFLSAGGEEESKKADALAA